MRRILLLIAAACATILAVAACGAHKPTLRTAPPTPTVHVPHHGCIGCVSSVLSPTVGEMFTANTGTWTNTPISYTYQWQDCNSSGASCSNITGATSSTYTASSSDVGDTIRVAVTAINASGSATAYSAVTGVVATVSGYSGTCTQTITTSSNPATVEASMSAGQVLCLDSGTYGTTSSTTENYFSASGSSGNPIVVTSAPGQTATIDGFYAITGSYVTLEYLNINGSNTAYPGPNNCGASGGTSQALFVSANYDIIQDDNVYQSVAGTRGVLIGVGFSDVGGSHTTIRYDDLSNAGDCDAYNHIVYDDYGTGTQIYDNWMWSDPYGYGVQLYQAPTNTAIYGNVIDGMLDGFVDDNTGGGDNVYNNVVINSVSSNSDGYSGGAFLDCYGGVSGAGDSFSNNAYYDDPAGFGCSSESGITFSGNMSLSANPFTNTADHVYTLGTNSAATSIAGYGLWNGNGPPSPDPALSLESAVLPGSGMLPPGFRR